MSQKINFTVNASVDTLEGISIANGVKLSGNLINIANTSAGALLTGTIEAHASQSALDNKKKPIMLEGIHKPAPTNTPRPEGAKFKFGVLASDISPFDVELIDVGKGIMEVHLTKEALISCAAVLKAQLASDLDIDDTDIS